MNKTTTLEGSYVETSDVEEQDDAYEETCDVTGPGVLRELDIGEPRRHMNTGLDETSRKRRKLDHSNTEEVVVFVDPFQKSDQDAADAEEGMGMEFDETASSRSSIYPQETFRIDPTLGDGSVLRDIKTDIRTSPQKLSASQKNDSSEKSDLGHGVSPPVAGGSSVLVQIKTPLSSQRSSLGPLLGGTNSQQEAPADQSHEESEDELAFLPPKSTSPGLTPQTGSGISASHFSRDDSPLSFPASSPRSPDTTSSLIEGEAMQGAGLEESATSAEKAVVDAESSRDEPAVRQRYPLRRRQPNQLHPYLYDDYQYKNGLKSNPAAIIDVLRLQRRRVDLPEDRYEEEEYVEEESQQQSTGRSENTDTQDKDPESPPRPLPAFLEPLTESDEDGEDLAKEARRIEREKRRREREERERERQQRKEEREAKKRQKRFPLPLTSSDSDSPVPVAQALPASQRNRASRTPSLSGKSRSETDLLRDYFMDYFTSGDDTDAEARRTDTPQREPAPFQRDDAHQQIVESESDTSSLPESDSDSETYSDQELHKFLSKQYRILCKMYPPKVAKEMLRRDKTKYIEKQRTRHLEEDAIKEDGPLLPGQSRIRKAANPRDMRDIRGDSESEEERWSTSPQRLYDGDLRDYVTIEPSTTSHTRDSHIEETQEPEPSRSLSTHRFSTPTPEVIVISDEEATDSSEDEQADQEDIAAYLGDDTPDAFYDDRQDHGNVKAKPESLIDWMLSRTRIVGTSISKPKIPKLPSRRRAGKPNTHRTRPHASRSKRKIDIIAQDARKYGSERQALLTFSHHTSAKRPDPSSDHQPTAGIATEPIEIEVEAMEPDKRKGWKERRKERQERAKKQGVYSMANPLRPLVTSGRMKKPVKITIDSNDGDFYHSFTQHQPHQQHLGTMRNAQAKGRADAAPELVGEVAGRKLPLNTLDPRRRRLDKRLRRRSKECTVGLRIETLQPGIKFSLASYVGRGWLHELRDILGNNAPVRPEPTYLCRLSITPSMGLDDFLPCLGQIFDGLLELSTDIPSDGYEETIKDWNTLARSACRFISWFRFQCDKSGRDLLSTFVKNKTLSTVAVLKSKEIPSNALDVVLLSLCWFCIEASVRAGHLLSDNKSESVDLKPLEASVRLMVHYLIGYGVRKPYKVVRKSHVLEDSKITCYAAQMWVCLIHLLPACDGQQMVDSHKENPLWREVIHYYQSLSPLNAFEAGEDLWKSIFALMALSNFSIHGISTSHSQLSSSWTLVAYAIKQVQLSQNLDKLPRLSRKALAKRDEYISIIISRCYHLLDYWKWGMDHSFGALNQLVDIFRARNFINLCHEEADYPDFMLSCDWNSLSQLQLTGDTAFTSVLKLLMRAIDSGRLSQSETKKMLALIIPISRFRSQKNVVPDANDLSPICNRLAAITLAIAVDPDSATRRIVQAQKSIDFKESDLSTQTLVIRGIRLLASLLIQRDIAVQGIAEWLGSIVEDATSEFKALRSLRYMAPNEQRDHENRIRNCMLPILALWAAGRLIMVTFASKVRYPNISFFLAFKPLLESECLKAMEEVDSNMHEMRRFIESFLDARTKCLPLPEPQLPAARIDDPDSQDYGDFDFGINFDDPTTLALLESQTLSFATIKEEEKKLLQTVVFPCFWVAQRKIRRFCEAAVDLLDGEGAAQLKTFDSWAFCAIGCMHILIQHGTLNDWSFCLNEIVPLWNRLRSDWLRVRIQVTIYAEILRHDPTFSAPQNTKLLDLMFESLATFSATTEPKYWRHIILQENGKNDIFRDTAGVLLLPDTEDLDSTDYKVFQTSLLQVFFRNIESGLQETTDPAPQIRVGIELTFKLLSMIRNNSQELASKPDDRAKYHLWCKDVFALFQDCPRLRAQQRLAFLLHWGTMLDNP